MEPNYQAAVSGLHIQKDIRGSTLVVHFEGGFSLSNHDLLSRTVQEINASTHRRIVLDLSGVGFIDSMGVGVIVSILKHARYNGVGFAVVTNDIVDQILGVANLSRILHAGRNLELALGASAP